VIDDQPSVLLVDDRRENLLALEAVLEPLPCRLVSVTSGEEALKAMLQENFACVLLDVQMPGMDGFETAELIKGRERTRNVPIIFVTAISKEQHHVYRGYSAGAVDYVFKPYDPAVLRSKVSVFLTLATMSRAAAHSEAVLRAAFDYAPIGKARLDLDGRIAEVNRAFAALLGTKPADLQDRLFDDFWHPEDAGRDAERRAALVSGGITRYDHEARLVSTAGEEIPVLAAFSLATPGPPIPDSLIVQVQDLRERKRAEAEREQLVREQAARAHAEQVSQRLEAVQRITDASLSTLAFDELISELLTRTADVLRADTAAVELRESDSAAFVYQVAGGVDASVQKRPNDPGSEHPLGDTVASVLTAPLRANGASIGDLVIGTLFPRRFSDDDAALLALAADRAALAIQRVRLYEREHAIAEELQRSLLPDVLPDLPGIETATRYFPAGQGSQVGGDWYDLVVQPNGCVLAIMGDVAGRGITAASTMGQLRSALRAYAFDGHSPGSVLERLNAFHSGLRPRSMSTVMLVSVDTETGSFTYAKAGHPPALMVTPEGETSWLDGAPGPLLGAIDEVSYEEGSGDLPLGHTLVLYTDGLVEHRGESIDRGFERLRAAAAGAPGPLEAFCDHLALHTLADPAVDDDVTLLALRKR
jgi:phosphoserine phosphatase RsbU/P